jgi:transcriptional regulator with XRE-family HTH domain
LPFCHAELRAPKPKPSHYPKLLNTLGDHLRNRRLDLGLLQSEVASRIGVATATITNWEGNKSHPEIRYMPTLLQFLGYNPLSEPAGFGERIATARKMTGLSQRKLAADLGVDPGTLKSWEAGEHKPVARNVELVERFLRTAASVR